MLSDTPESTSYVLLPSGRTWKLPSLDLHQIKDAVSTVSPPLDGGRVSRLNKIAQSLGFPGWAELSASWPRVEAFMKEHGLVKRADLLKAATYGPLFTLKRRQVADRLYLGKPVERLFTGAQAPSDSFFFAMMKSAPDWLTFDPSPIEAISRSAKNQILEDVVGRYGALLWGSFNLIGDNLVFPSNEATWVHKHYQAPPQTKRQWEDFNNRASVVYKCFRSLIERMNAGWVDVLWFEDKFAVLRGINGEYDVIVRRIRDEDMPGVNEVPMPPDYMPSSLVQELGFKRWSYGSDRWAEKDHDEAEKYYYASTGGTAEAHPGANAILKTYLRACGIYNDRPPKFDRQLAGFVKTRLKNGEFLYVAKDCVSIAEFRLFLKTSMWDRFREGQKLDLFSEARSDLPTPATWLDAMAYCGWYEREFGCPVRLLRRSEYLELTAQLPDDKPDQDGHCLLWSPRYVSMNDRIQGHPPAESVKYKDSFDFAVTPTGLRFVKALDFHEWLQEKRLLRLCGGYREMDLDIDAWGWHIGNLASFRLCYPVA